MTEKTAVHTPTKEEYDRLMVAYEKKGWKSLCSHYVNNIYPVTVTFKEIFEHYDFDWQAVNCGYTIITVDEAIGKLSEDYMPKPVEQELIPLDELTIDKVRALWIQLLNEETLGLQRDDVPENIIYNFLSKYGVHKQEEVKGCNNTTFEENFGKLYGTYRKFQTAKVQERLVKSGYIMHDVENNNEALRDFLKYYHMIQD